MARSNLILSDAEWEYACQYVEYLTVGDVEPDPDGFWPDRIKEIQRAITAEYYSRRNAMFGNIADRIRR